MPFKYNVVKNIDDDADAFPALAEAEIYEANEPVYKINLTAWISSEKNELTELTEFLETLPIGTDTLIYRLERVDEHLYDAHRIVYPEGVEPLEGEPEPKGAVVLSYRRGPRSYVNASVTTNCLGILNLWRDLYKDTTAGPELKKGGVSVLIQSPHGLAMQAIGHLDVPLVPQNYSPEVVSDVEHMLSCLGSDCPCGRLSILDGPPGTGKSFLIRAIASSLDARVVLVSPSMIGSISGPNVLPILIEHRRRSDQPVVLILEDADSSLVDRKRGNQSNLSELLNLGDGLIGEMCDIRLIATTNTPRIDMDAAILRPGRLCRHITIPALSKEQAEAAYAHHQPDVKRQVDGEETLATIYRRMRDDGWGPDEKKGEEQGQYL